VAFAIALKRRGPFDWRRSTALAGAALGTLAITLGVWLVLARVLDREASAQLSTATSTSGLNIRELLSYLWQFYLPRLPFQTDFPSVGDTIPVYDVWLKMGWAAFGWTEVTFPGPVYVALAAVTVLVGGAAAVRLWRDRFSVDRGVAALFLLAAVVLLAGLHWTEYRQLESGAGSFNQGRYLFPLIGIGGLATAQAIRLLAPARRSLAVAGVVSGLFLLQVASLALMMVRFYA
jgi:hypothetical protein